LKYSEATRKDLRGTGVVVGIACIVLGILQFLFHGKIDPVILGIAGGILILLGLVLPEALRPFHYVWMKLAHVLGYVMNRVILGLLFYIVFTLMSLILRLIGRDAMTRDFRKRQESYWVHRPETDVVPERYERQF